MVFNDINLPKHTKIMKTVVFCFNVASIQQIKGAKVHMDTMGTNREPEGAPNIAKKLFENGFQREKK